MSEERRVLERAVESFAPDPDQGLTRTLERARRRQRRQRAVAAVVVLVVFGGAAAGLWATFRPLPGHAPASVISPKPATHPATPRPMRRGNIPPGFVKQVVLSSSRTTLALEAPPDVVRWTFHASTCSVAGKWLHQQGGGGFGGAGCQGDAYLSFGGGSLGQNGALFTVMSGRTLPIAGVHVRVTLANGKTKTVKSSNGLWMVVIQRCGDYFGTEIRTIQAIGPEGKVIDAKSLPQQSELPGPWPPC
jgi:hypothetical protein